MNPKETLLAALEEVERHEQEIDGGEVKMLCVVFSVENDDGQFGLGWVSSSGPYYAVTGLLGEAQASISEAAYEPVGEDDEED